MNASEAFFVYVLFALNLIWGFVVGLWIVGIMVSFYRKAVSEV